MNCNRLVPVVCIALLTAWIGSLTRTRATEREIPPAFGPYVNLKPEAFAASRSFSSADRIVGTYYFYWYDISTREHIIDPEDGTDALTTHPPTLEDFSYKSVRWHRTQLADMEAAGIDVVLPVFWGSPAEHATNSRLHWSFAGLPPLVQAREELLRQGRQPPRIGLFYDTSTLRWNSWGYHADLTTDYGKRFFYATIRDFFSCIPPQHWAMMDGKPIVLLYAAAFAKRWDQSFVDYVKAEFPKEFGGRVPWIAPQDSWGVKGDNLCAWGGALGLKNPGIAQLGPGYDHSAVPGRTPLVRDRENGRFYRENWLQFLRRPSNFVMIETWNEFHEGTDIAESREYGRQYIELTRTYADRFKQGWRPPSDGPFSKAKSVSASAGDPAGTRGLTPVTPEDGQASVTEIKGRTAWASKPFRDGRVAYLYFRVDDSFKTNTVLNARVEVVYCDVAAGRLRVEFDGSDEAAPGHGAYSRANEIELAGDREWKVAAFDLDAARFFNRQNGGADFRLAAIAPELVVQRVTLKRR
ncbi:MAG: DUF5010 domain-containing protein [Verrucomicrobiae bacterium]|nr:DUF5010 domain-containing protein [Verrucomicrobiae bacterium]